MRKYDIWPRSFVEAAFYTTKTMNDSLRYFYCVIIIIASDVTNVEKYILHKTLLLCYDFYIIDVSHRHVDVYGGF